MAQQQQEEFPRSRARLLLGPSNRIESRLTTVVEENEEEGGGGVGEQRPAVASDWRPEVNWLQQMKPEAVPMPPKRSSGVRRASTGERGVSGRSAVPAGQQNSRPLSFVVWPEERRLENADSTGSVPEALSSPVAEVSTPRDAEISNVSALSSPSPALSSSILINIMAPATSLSSFRRSFSMMLPTISKRGPPSDQLTSLDPPPQEVLDVWEAYAREKPSDRLEALYKRSVKSVNDTASEIGGYGHRLRAFALDELEDELPAPYQHYKAVEIAEWIDTTRIRPVKSCHDLRKTASNNSAFSAIETGHGDPQQLRRHRGFDNFSSTKRSKSASPTVNNYPDRFNNLNVTSIYHNLPDPAFLTRIDQEPAPNSFVSDHKVTQHLMYWRLAPHVEFESLDGRTFSSRVRGTEVTVSEKEWFPFGKKGGGDGSSGGGDDTRSGNEHREPILGDLSEAHEQQHGEVSSGTILLTGDHHGTMAAKSTELNGDSRTCSTAKDTIADLVDDVDPDAEVIHTFEDVGTLAQSHTDAIMDTKAVLRLRGGRVEEIPMKKVLASMSSRLGRILSHFKQNMTKPSAKQDVARRITTMEHVTRIKEIIELPVNTVAEHTVIPTTPKVFKGPIFENITETPGSTSPERRIYRPMRRRSLDAMMLSNGFIVPAREGYAVRRKRSEMFVPWVTSTHGDIRKLIPINLNKPLPKLPEVDVPAIGKVPNSREWIEEAFRVAGRLELRRKRDSLVGEQNATLSAGSATAGAAGGKIA